jgi:hypothetical protein
MELKDLENLFQSVIAGITGLDPVSGVRISWPTDGAPAWGNQDNVIFIRVTEDDEPINKQKDESIDNTPDGTALVQTITFNRVDKLALVIYGPDSWKNAQKIRTQMFYQSVHDLLALQGIYLVTDIAAPVRFPEVWSKKWWERVDLSIRFNEQIIDTLITPYITSGEVIVETDDGVVRADITAT